MFENQIKAAKTELLEHVHTGQQYVYLRDLCAQEAVHPFYTAFFAAEVEWWLLEQRMLRVGNPRFNYASNEFAGLFDSMDNISRHEARFDAHDLKSVLDLAVKTRINYLLRPRTTLKWFVFRGEPTKPLREVLLRMAYFNAYPYLIDGFRKWAAARRVDEAGMDLLSVVEFERALETIDNDEILDYSTNEFAGLLDPIFEFFAEVDSETPQKGIPTPALIVFLDDKGVFRISQELEKRIRTEELHFIHKSDFLRVIEDVLHEVEEDPDAMTLERQTELSRDFAAESELEESNFADDGVDEYVVSASFEGEEDEANTAADSVPDTAGAASDSENANVFSLSDAMREQAQGAAAQPGAESGADQTEVIPDSTPGSSENESVDVNARADAADQLESQEIDAAQAAEASPTELSLENSAADAEKDSQDLGADASSAVTNKMDLQSSSVEIDPSESAGSSESKAADSIQSDDSAAQAQDAVKESASETASTGQTDNTQVGNEDEPAPVLFEGLDRAECRAALAAHFADGEALAVHYTGTDSAETVGWSETAVSTYAQTYLADPDFDAVPQTVDKKALSASSSEFPLLVNDLDAVDSPGAESFSEPATDPESIQPEAVEQPAAEPEVTERSVNEPESVEPSVEKPSVEEPEPEVHELEAVEPEASHSEEVQPEAAAPTEEPAAAESPAAAPTEEPSADEAPAAAPTEEPSANETPAAAPTEEPSANETPAAAPIEEPAADEAPADAPTEELQADEVASQESGAVEPQISESEPAQAEAVEPSSANSDVAEPTAGKPENTEKQAVAALSDAELQAMFAIADSQRDKIIKKVFRNDSSRLYAALRSLSEEKHWKAALNRVDLILAEQDVNPMAPAAATFRELIINRFAAE